MAIEASTRRSGRPRTTWTGVMALIVAHAGAFTCLAASTGGTLPGWTPPARSPTDAGPPAQQLQMIFPANPPPLGTWVPRLEHLLPPLTDPARPLCGDVLEPYFAPLSTYLIDVSLTLDPKLIAMIADYRTTRAKLVADLRHALDAGRSMAAADRLATFSRLAAEQGSQLAALEQTAETIRGRVARHVNWNRSRRWQLGRNELKGPREQHGIFEYQVVRAAAFYEGGLAPAQRRLLREAAAKMEVEIFRRPDSASALFEFFSPDLMPVWFPTSLPAAIADDVTRHARRKEELRAELRDALYDADHLRAERRERAFAKLAAQQQPVIDALEDLAEGIRRAVAAWDTSWRRPPPAFLPANIQSQLEAYLELQRQHQIDYELALMPVKFAQPPVRLRGNANALTKWRAEQQQRMEDATKEFLRAQASVVAELQQRLRQLDAALSPYYDSSDIGTEKESVLNFVHRRRQEATYCEYEIAAFEPGLSPRQRALLFAAAVARLELPLPAPERAPVETPKTMFK